MECVAGSKAHEIRKTNHDSFHHPKDTTIFSRRKQINKVYFYQGKMLPFRGNFPDNSQTVLSPDRVSPCLQIVYHMSPNRVQ